jgi:beta-glucanase (GH16 family)
MDQVPAILRCLSVLLCLGLAACSEGQGENKQQQHQEREVDLSRFTRTFKEDFQRFSVSAWGPGTRWIAHTPWHGDFGDAEFTDPLPGFPFVTGPEGLRIEARKDAAGKWRSGLISSRDHDGYGGPGFAQQYGYFEMTAKLPKGPGVWPAFWLVGIDNSKSRAEIDVLEYYGVSPSTYHVTVHVWAEDETKFGDNKVVTIGPSIATDQFNKYSVLIDENWVTFYFNRREVWRTPTRKEFKQPMYMLANLALGSGWPIDKTINPSFMYIKSIEAYAARGTS